MLNPSPTTLIWNNQIYLSIAIKDYVCCLYVYTHIICTILFTILYKTDFIYTCYTHLYTYLYRNFPDNNKKKNLNWDLTFQVQQALFA